MKHKLIIFSILLTAMLVVIIIASAATDPIVCTMEVEPSTLSEPGDVTITITISNAGDTDMTDPLVLYDPTSQIVTDFGDNGSVTLKAGEVKTWTGTWAVNQRTLENGQIVFFVKYTIVDDSGSSKTQSQPIRGEIELATYEAIVTVNRTIVPETAYEGQTVYVIYDISNDGTVSIANLALDETNDVLEAKLTIADELKAGETAQFKIPVVMGTEDLISQGIVYYTIADGTQEQTVELEEQTITYGEPEVFATLTADSKGVLQNETIKLTLTVENTGDIDYTDVRVTDETLGDVFTNLTLAAGETLVLEKEITLTQSTDFMFEVLATGSSGTQESYLSNSLSLIALDPEAALNIEIILSSDKSEVYSTSEAVRFSATITNLSTVDATEVNIYQADTLLYTFASIPAGETRTLTRDVTLNMEGQYQFRAEAKDSIDNELTFKSNILQIAFLEPTPVPITPDPNLTPTPEPTFVKATYPSINDPDIGALPKLLRTFFYPLMIAGVVLFIIAAVILLLATKKRNALKKASENALDHLERSNHRDYILPADEKEEAVSEETEESTVYPEDETEPVAEPEPDMITEEELPHMKYVRNAYQIADQNAQDDNQNEDAYQTDQQEYTVDAADDTAENPYKRRTSRVSPYAKESDDIDNDNIPPQEDNRQD